MRTSICTAGRVAGWRGWRGAQAETETETTYLDLSCAANTREWHPRGGDAFRKGYNIGLNIVVLEAKHLSRAAEAGHHL